MVVIWADSQGNLPMISVSHTNYVSLQDRLDLRLSNIVATRPKERLDFGWPVDTSLSSVEKVKIVLCLIHQTSSIPSE